MPHHLHRRLENLRAKMPPNSCTLVGAGDGSGGFIQLIHSWNIAHCTLFEAEDAAVQLLRRSPFFTPQWRVDHRPVAKDAAVAPYYRLSVPSESGLLPAQALRGLWPRIASLHTQNRATAALDALNEDTDAPTDAHWLIIDCLAGLPILQGARDWLERVGVVVVRAIVAAPSWSASPKNSQIHHIEQYLVSRQFQLLDTYGLRHPALAHAVFVRNREIKRPSVAALQPANLPAVRLHHASKQNDGASSTQQLELLPERKEHMALLGNTRIPVKLLKGAGDTLAVFLHGALSRDRVVTPYFRAFLPISCHQLIVADPALLEHPNLRTGFYLGTQAQPLIEALPVLIREIAHSLGATRYIIAGGSAGGYSALYHAHALGSAAIAVASCPQTTLLSPSMQPIIHKLRTLCFPGFESDQQLAQHLSLDLCQRYGQGADNAVLMLYSAGDRYHLKQHLAPFLSALPGSVRRRMVLEVGFWGTPGHSGSVPDRAILPWLRTLIATTSWDAETLLAAHRASILPGPGV